MTAYEDQVFARHVARVNEDYARGTTQRERKSKRAERGDLTPLYELIVAMLMRGERTIWCGEHAIKMGFNMMVHFPTLDSISLDVSLPEDVSIRAGCTLLTTSQLGRAILAAW